MHKIILGIMGIVVGCMSTSLIVAQQPQQICEKYTKIDVNGHIIVEKFDYTQVAELLKDHPEAVDVLEKIIFNRPMPTLWARLSRSASAATVTAVKYLTLAFIVAYVVDYLLAGNYLLNDAALKKTHQMENLIHNLQNTTSVAMNVARGLENNITSASSWQTPVTSWFGNQATCVIPGPHPCRNVATVTKAISDIAQAVNSTASSFTGPVLPTYKFGTFSSWTNNIGTMLYTYLVKPMSQRLYPLCTNAYQYLPSMSEVSNMTLSWLGRK